ncbi:hypothetical protein Golob_023404, partial [Gossypium lobatum]|nr:hypothetical protein [Gossypium lobatum]
MEFIIDKDAAMVSQTIRNMLTSPGPIENWVFLGSLLFFGLK